MMAVSIKFAEIYIRIYGNGKDKDGVVLQGVRK